MPLFHLFLCLLLSFAPKLSASESCAQSPVFTMEGLPATIVNGSVNVISGDYCESEIDLIVPGPEPISIGRSHSSAAMEMSTLYQGWSSNQFSLMEIQKEQLQSNNKQPTKAVFHSPSGAIVCLSTKDFNTRGLEIDIGKHARGLTNCGQGSISGQTNLKNTSLKRATHPTPYEISTGDSSKFLYKPVYYLKPTPGYAPNGQYWLTQQNLPNGNKLFYEYNHVQEPTSITAKDTSEKATLASVRYLTHANSDRSFRELNIKGSNKRELKYTFLNNKLSKVESSHTPETQYLYEERPFLASYGLITRRNRPDNRYLITEYYGVKANDVGGSILSLGEKDLRLKRVKLQRAPVGHDSTPIITSRFFYNVNPEYDNQYGRGEPVEGSTEVYDALNNKTVYHYDRHQRLTQVETFEKQAKKSYTLKRRELFFWGEITSHNAGNLISKAIQNEKSQTLACTTYKYDRRGNITKETLWGNLSGAQNTHIQLDANGSPTNRNVESYNIRYTYSNDERNLMLSKLEDNGLRTEHVYKANTNLLSEKYLYQGEQLLLRNFFQYSSFGALTEVIVDDGTTRDPKSLKGVSERKLTSIQLRKKSPGFGQAELVSEFGLDLSRNQLKLINKTAKSYNAHDLIDRETFYDANNKVVYTLSKTYDERDRLVGEQDSRGKSFSYRYDANGNKVYSQGPTRDFHTEYTYDFSNRLVSEKEVHKNRQIFSKSFRYDYLSNQIASTDIYGNETDYKYDVFGNATERVFPQVLNEKNKAYRPTEHYSYDVFGNKISETDPAGNITRTEYNIRGNVTAIHHPDGTHELFFYNLDGSLKKKTEKNGSYTLFQRNFKGEVTEAKIYSSRGALLKTLRNSYSSFHKISSTDGEGHTTHYQYDYAGRLFNEGRGDKKIAYEYDSVGQVCKIQSKYGINKNEYLLTIREYDLFGNVTKEALLDHTGKELLKQTFRYDINGNKTHEISYGQAGPATTVTEYNSFNKPVKIIDALGNTTRISYHFTEKNRLGQKIPSRTVVDANGKITITKGDALLRIVEFQQKDSRGYCLDKRSFDYDKAGNKVTDTHHVYGDRKELYSVSTSWEYGPGNQLRKLTEAQGTREQKVTTYHYNAQGQLEHSRKPNGVKLSRTYDPIGRLHFIYSSDGSINDEYSYNANDQVTRAYDHTRTKSTHRSYDSYNRISNETLDNGLQIGYLYDLHDRPGQVTLPDNSSIKYHFDAGFLKEIHRYDPTGKRQYVQQYTSYDHAGNLLQATPIAGKQNISLQWDKLGRCTEVTQDHYRWKIPKNGFDRVGNLNKIEISDPLGTYQGSFTYNSRYQLNSEEGVSDHQYAYDSRNNRLNKDEQRYQHNRVDSLLRDGVASYSYDACGNLTKKQVGDKEILYTYDAFDRLLSITEKDFLSVSYEYDAFHRRTSKRVSKWDSNSLSWVNTSDLLFLYQGENEIGATDLDRKIVELRILGSGRGAEIGAAVAIELDEKVYAPIHDHRGSVAALVDMDTHNIVESYRHTAFGEEEIYDEEQNLIEESSIGNPWRYSSKRVEEESGMIFFGRRYYAPDIGRWITPDPAGLKDGPNLYAYVASSPMIYYDLFGLFKTNPELHKHYSEQAKEVKDIDTKELKKVVDYASRDLDKKRIKAKGKDLSKGKISFGNGIWNSLKEHEETLAKLVDLSGGYSITGIYNDSRGPGALKALFESVGYKTTEVMNLRTEFCQSFLDFAHQKAKGEDIKHLHISHSQGGIQAKHALTNLPEAVQQHVEVFNVNGAKIVPGKYCSHADNVQSSRDFVPKFDIGGQIKYKDQIQTTKAHQDASLIDHPISSPTMVNPLTRVLTEFVAEHR